MRISPRLYRNLKNLIEDGTLGLDDLERLAFRELKTRAYQQFDPKPCAPGCAACCHAKEDDLYFECTARDARRIARYLGMPVEEFRERYTNGPEFKKKKNGACPMLWRRKCSVYPVKPRYCTEFKAGSICCNYARARLGFPAL